MLSGIAGIANQVVWQRALKITLGGSETLSAMVVVLVFMLGLGLGAWLAGRGVGGVRHPLRALAGVELGLAVVNLTIAVVLGADITESVYAAQRLAVGLGVPLRAVYALASAVLLLAPTVLMGVTVPLASEASQRQLGATGNPLVAVLFFVNTAGAATGAVAASSWLLPRYGQWVALLAAVGCNLGAAGLVGVASLRVAPAAPRGVREVRRASLPSRTEWVGATLGLLSLGYEMVLFRSLVLSHGPLPDTFALGLCFFLLFWSVGVLAAGRVAAVRDSPALVAGLTLVVVLALPTWGVLERWHFEDATILRTGWPWFVPCVGFGALYGTFVARDATAWGRDVGRFQAMNTLGSCAGILAFTLVGYELEHRLNAMVIALGLLALALDELSRGGERTFRPELRAARIGSGLSAVGALAVVGWGLTVPHTTDDGIVSYWGRDGVIDVDDAGNVFIDGLWHTRLTDGADHIGRPYTWVMATAAVMAAPEDDPPERALVIGAGVGISSACLAGVDGLKVDGYEINHTLKRVLRDFPEQTLQALHHPRIRWIWRDARTGLALDPTRYDIILSAPLHLRQAGSSLLLSVEYLRLVKSRLAPGGVLALYSHEGNEAQYRLIQRTVAELFEHRVSWYDGVVTVASDRPIALGREELARRMAAGRGRLFREMRQLDRQIRDEGDDDGLYGWYDGPVDGALAPVPITDDHPLLEYPEEAARQVGARSSSGSGGPASAHSTAQ